MRILFILLINLTGAANAFACEALLSAHLTRVRRAGEHLYGAVRVGDIVTIGPKEPRGFDWEAVNVAEGVVNSFAIESPYAVRVLRVLPGGKAKIQLLDNDEEILLVPINDLTAHADDSVRDLRFARRLKALAAEPLTFTVGERVRLRVDGLMTTGEVTSLDGGAIEVDHVRRSVDEVFKLVGARPRTIIHRDGRHRMLDLDVPRDQHLAFMNQVARWTSRADFRALPTRRKLDLLARLTVNMNAYHRSALTLDHTKNLAFSTLLRQSYGVCGQLNPVTAAVLAETGYPVRIVKYRYHMWTEVQIQDGRGRRETWIAESSCRDETTSGAWRRRDLKKRPTKFAKPYYLRPDLNIEYTSPDWVP